MDPLGPTCWTCMGKNQIDHVITGLLSKKNNANQKNKCAACNLIRENKNACKDTGSGFIHTFVNIRFLLEKTSWL